MIPLTRVTEWIRTRNRARLEARRNRRRAAAREGGPAPADAAAPDAGTRTRDAPSGPPRTVRDLLAHVAALTPGFEARLADLKRANPQVAWYPFRSMDKLHLLARVGGYFDAHPVPFRGPRPAVLDVGAADGDVSFLFEAAGCDVVAVDNAPSNFNRCAGIRAMRDLLGSAVQFVDRDIDRGVEVEGEYDLVLFMDILYHLRNPLGALISLCQAGRYMVLTTRIFESAPGVSHAGEIPAAYLLAPFEAAPNDPTNYWIFTEAGLRRLLERSGWRILRDGWFGYAGKDASPSDPRRDKRVVALCERVPGYENLVRGHVLSP